MMFDHIKKSIIKGLIEEISSLNPTDLELVGHAVLEFIEKKKLVHHGLNKDNMPSGYTVDTFSQDSKIVGEYSTEKDYFTGRGPKDKRVFEKIENDINHAIGHQKAGGLEKIYLVTSQEEPASFRETFNKTDIGKSYSGIVSFLDARELAKLIFAQTTSDQIQGEFYKSYFYDFSRNLDNYEYYGKIPAQCEYHVLDEGIIRSIDGQLSKSNVCVLCGLSGSGKTQATIDFIHLKAKDFERYIWISGEDWKPDTPLSSIQRVRGGFPFNVSGFFNTAKTILVIDSFERSLNPNSLKELEPGFALGGVVIITSQLVDTGNPAYLRFPVLSLEVAYKILGEDPSTASPISKEFVTTCSFSPLILATTRRVIELQKIPKDDLYREILAGPEKMGQDDGSPIMRKILGRIDVGPLNALKKIAYSGLTINDSTFLGHFIGYLDSVNLQKLGILKPTSTPGLLVVHDLVCKALQDKLDQKTLADAVESFIARLNGDMTPSVLRQIHLSSSQIYQEHLRRGERSPDWLVYALLQIDGDRRRDIQKQIHEVPVTKDLGLAEVKCIIDAKEAHSYSIEEHKERRDYYDECASSYEAAYKSSDDEFLRAEFLHHRGKSLRRSGKFEEALKCFQILLEYNPTWHATHNQIAHLGTQYEANELIKKEGEKSIRFLIREIRRNSSDVPLRVSLAAVSRLRSYQPVIAEISAEKEMVEQLANVIALAALEGLDQFYDAYVSFTSMFAYRHGAICIQLAETLPEMLNMSPKAVDKKHWISASEGLINTAVAAKRVKKQELSNRLISAGIKYVEAFEARGKFKPFETRAIAKVYNTAELPDRALTAIGRQSDADNDHWLLYQKSKSLQLANRLGEALEVAKVAFKLFESDSKNQSRRSSYLDLLSQCYEATGDHANAINELKEAVAKCDDDEYLRDLRHRLDSLNSKYDANH